MEEVGQYDYKQFLDLFLVNKLFEVHFNFGEHKFNLK